MSDLVELAERCEKATGPDRELDALVHEACGRPFEMEYWTEADTTPQRNLSKVPQYSRSLDAAMTLLPTDGSMNFVDVNFSWEPGEVAVWPAATVRWYPPHKAGPDWHALIVSAATLPLTICAAALRARAAEPEGNHP